MVEGTCTGSTAECPDDDFLQASQVCRDAAGVCDTPEVCSGESATCPADLKSTAQCRGTEGPCDVPEYCDGVQDSCPGDGFLQASLVCRGAAGVCDLPEACDGSSAFCPADLKSTDVCRASAGVCDVAESCNGVSDACPADTVVAAGTVCRPGTSSCDPAEVCSGASGVCPADVNAACTLCGEKYYDANASGEFDPQDTTLAGWQVTATGPLASLTTVTDAFGRYTFSGLPEGDYTVCESVPNEPNWLQNEPVQVCYTVHLPSAEAQACRLDFGNVCLGAGGGHTIGFWGNQNGRRKFLGADQGAMALLVLNTLNLASEDGSAFNPTTYDAYAAWLRNVRAVNMAYMLSAQLSATSLNVLAGFVDANAKIYAPGTNSADAFGFATVKDVAAEANTELGLHPLTLAGSPYRAYQDQLKQALDKANNNLNFLQSEPCAFSFPPVAVP